MALHNDVCVLVNAHIHIKTTFLRLFTSSIQSASGKTAAKTSPTTGHSGGVVTAAAAAAESREAKVKNNPTPHFLCARVRAACVRPSRRACGSLSSRVFAPRRPAPSPSPP